MLHWKSFAGSIVLAGLILQGCGGSSDTATADIQKEDSAQVKSFNASTSFLSNAPLSPEDKTQVQSDLTLKLAQLDATDAEMHTYIDSVIADNAEINTRMDAYQAVAEAMSGSSANGAPSRSIFSKITDKIKDGLVKVLDTSVGHKITGAAFDVVLNSDGVTVFMLDEARHSETIAQIMVDAIEAKWSLTEKMCPMLQENSEFGEKFTALAEERDFVGRFFFERIDANMYGCLTDAMLLSNNEASHDGSVSHSTNGYMALLMDRYAVDYFIQPTGSTADRRNDKFVSLLLNTGKNVIYTPAVRDGNGDITTPAIFENHGDGNELINEKFFYSLFKTPTTTESFVSAMDKIDVSTRTMLMDNIFLGAKPVGDADTYQGYLNIIAIGSAMYDGIYGAEGAPTYGFGAYSSAFIGFAKLIPSDRYMTYATAFFNAGVEYANYYNIDAWGTVTAGAQDLWNSYTGGSTAAGTPAPTRSAGLGVLGSDWYDDTIDLFLQAWSNISLTDLTTDLLKSDASVLNTLNDQLGAAYATVLDGRNENNETVYGTELTNGVHTNQTVYGLHGMIELAVQEDIYAAMCGNRPFTAAGDLYTASCDNNGSYSMTNAKNAFTLPLFSQITWSFAYGAATDGVTSYWTNVVDADWLANFSSNELIRNYFYPSADNAYIPSWLMAIDWLKVPATATSTYYEAIDFSFDGGYLDVYIISEQSTLLTDVELDNALAPIKDNIEFTAVTENSDSIIAVDTNGQTLAGLYVYKIRVVTPSDTEAVLAALAGLGSDALNAIGIDSDNATQTVTQ